MGTTDLCNDDPNQIFRLDIYEASHKGNHKIIGSFETTMNKLEKVQDFEYEVPRAKFELKKIIRERKNTLLEYVFGGC